MPLIRNLTTPVKNGSEAELYWTILTVLPTLGAS